MRVARFSGSDTNQLQPAEREHDHRQRKDKPLPAGRQEPPVLPQVVDRGTLTAMTREQQPQAKTNHADNRQHLDERKPELGFTVQTDVHKVDGIDDNEEGRRPNPGGHIREPVLHVDASGGQLCHPHQHKHHPVVPAGEEPRKRAPVFIRKVRKRA